MSGEVEVEESELRQLAEARLSKTGVMRDVEPGTSVLGTPAFEDRIFLRQLSSLRKLPEFMAMQRSLGRA